MRRPVFRMVTAEIDRPGKPIGGIDLEFGWRKRTPRKIIEVGIQLHIAGISLSNTMQFLEGWVSTGAGRGSTTGCRKQMYSPAVTSNRITSRLTRRWFSSSTSATGCTSLLIWKRTHSPRAAVSDADHGTKHAVFART